jgi:uncharacterized protein (DUF1330 family)
VSKGYWIAHIDVHDIERYTPYIAASGDAISSYGGRFSVRGGDHQQVEGAMRSRHVVVEFASYERALACYHSTIYGAARQLRNPFATADIVVIAGFIGFQSVCVLRRRSDHERC